jgi:uncharacterized protein YceH (UPF0502 family)
MPAMELSDTEVRVLGALIEKEMTTPDAYPLTLNALEAACNQRTNRHPVVTYGDAAIIETVNRLRDRELCRLTHVPGQRAVKYKQALVQKLELEPGAAAVVAVLMLRGAQTPGELRSRTSRYHEFSSPAEVETILDELGRRDPPVVSRLERRPGEKENRWVHRLGLNDDAEAAAPPPVEDHPALEERIGTLEREVGRLRDVVERLQDMVE